MSDNSIEIIKQFAADKIEALSPPLDKEKIISFATKYNIEAVLMHLTIDEVFWGAVHKAITGTTSLPIEYRKESKKWLDEHGLKSLDDGDL